MLRPGYKHCKHQLSGNVFRMKNLIFYSLPFGQAEANILLAQTSFQLSPKAFWRAELISQFFCFSKSSKKITCPSGKLKTEFTSPIAKSTSPRLLDTTFFARCKILTKLVENQLEQIWGYHGYQWWIQTLTQGELLLGCS